MKAVLRGGFVGLAIGAVMMAITPETKATLAEGMPLPETIAYLISGPIVFGLIGAAIGGLLALFTRKTA